MGTLSWWLNSTVCATCQLRLFLQKRERTSFKYIAVMVKGRHAKAETARHGRRYGYSAQKVWEKRFGQRSCGRDRIPPIRGLPTEVIVLTNGDGDKKACQTRSCKLAP